MKNIDQNEDSQENVSSQLFILTTTWNASIVWTAHLAEEATTEKYFGLDL